MKTFYDYTNKIGEQKRIYLTKVEEDWYYYTIWNRTTYWKTVRTKI